jgi:hypothetical protein
MMERIDERDGEQLRYDVESLRESIELERRV